MKLVMLDKKNDCCGPASATGEVSLRSSCCPGGDGSAGPWVTGSIDSPAGRVPAVSAEWSALDRWEHIKCRVSAFRSHYSVPPGLYAVGAPGAEAEVFVTANYKLSFDHLRKALKGIDGWVLVLDTRGINVWCAAGKGTFGTDELVRRIAVSRLSEVVTHRRLILPQLAGPGVNAASVRKTSGFSVCYGPVSAADIPAYVASGRKAEGRMRLIKFTFVDRLMLTPMEIVPAMKKYFPWYALLVLLFFGLHPSGILFRDALKGGLPFLLLGLVSVAAGAFFAPLFLPFIPSRSFAVKGWLAGAVSLYLCYRFAGIPEGGEPLLLAFSFLFFPMASSYLALQFTGSTTFTGMSGVKRELKYGVPVYGISALLSLLCLIIFKLAGWGHT